MIIDGKLENVKRPGKSFIFDTSKELSERNQMHYEALCEAIDEHVYKLLEEEDLERLPVPKASCSTIEFQSFIYASKDSLQNDKLIILVNGCGAKAGQWSRHTIIHDNFYYGTQISYIREAKKLGYGILVLNINDNFRITAEYMHSIPGSEDGYEHLSTVWNDYVLDCKAKNIAIIAHDFGGDCIVQYKMIFGEKFKDRVFAIALISSMRLIRWKDSNLEDVIKTWDNKLDLKVKRVKTSKNRTFNCLINENNRENLPYLCMTPVFTYIQSKYLLKNDRKLSDGSS
ncbi:PREDICTED: UPF0528 protein CG10038 [Dinoponera quadriceps]|uniref:UPF0528 protein CG10038 n=1 Tax=Dinoponera quadriceps TaxID=609295 RepID=A0A6P3XN32_DINQU|nr:PREDICTED: UPF0528 protein CG10038 [Dinoponera quadriceps]